MSWRIFTDDWRLKLLALLLAVLMLGAVAFSQNPPTSGSLTVALSYANIPSNLILVSPPGKITVTYTGVADAITGVNASNLTATVDVSHAKPGDNVQLNVTAKTTVGGVIPQNPPPITVKIDTYVQDKDLVVQPSALPAAGWGITDMKVKCPNSPCHVHFSGPSAWLKNMTATVTYQTKVNLTSISSPTLPIQLTNSTGLVDLTTCRTDPCATLDTLTAEIDIQAEPGSNVNQVTLIDSPPSHGPAAGYRVTNVTVTPIRVLISGDPVLIGRFRTINLPAVDLTGKTADYTATVNIPYPDGVSGSVPTATIKYSISANPAVSPSPT